MNNKVTLRQQMTTHVLNSRISEFMSQIEAAAIAHQAYEESQNYVKFMDRIGVT